MGLFSRRQELPLKRCKLCDKELRTDAELSIELCQAHALILDSDVRTVSLTIEKCQPLANAAKNSNEKISYLQLILDALYMLKIKYYDNDIRPLDQDIDELIDPIIEAISEAKK